jgi:hypothetical protein
MQINPYCAFSPFFDLGKKPFRFDLMALWHHAGLGTSSLSGIVIWCDYNIIRPQNPSKMKCVFACFRVVSMNTKFKFYYELESNANQ